MCCFANETVTTVVYTDCHTRPLHEARPILFQKEPGTFQALRATRLNLDPRRSGPPDDPHGRARQIELDLTAGRDRSLPMPIRRFGAGRCGKRAGERQQKPPLHARSARQTKPVLARSEEHTSELQSLMRISYAVFCL